MSEVIQVVGVVLVGCGVVVLMLVSGFRDMERGGR
jgi:hypothetical protein